MKILKKLLLVWMIVWLPAAGALAATMPLSGPMTVASATMASLDEQDNAVMPCHSKAVPEKSSFGQACNHCVLCHLAGALAMPEMPEIATVRPTHVFTAAPLSAHPSFVPEPISPPPRRSAI